MSPAHRLIPFDLLVEAVCEAAGEDVSDVFTRSRRRDLVTARRAIVLLARRHTPLSFEEIARRLGRRTHSGVYEMFLAARMMHGPRWLTLLERSVELARVHADAARTTEEAA
ncbi:MAG: hypothetical protein BroJett004_08310 [Planctomycetota bacterium]|nr:MAG: hypothetical protein BroJett004_08310 [Planctomycetota bacterium]